MSSNGEENWRTGEAREKDGMDPLRAAGGESPSPLVNHIWRMGLG
jgi:hypothetical protein